MPEFSKKPSCVKYNDLTVGTVGVGIYFVNKVIERTDINGFKYVTFSLRTVDLVPLTARLFKADEWLDSINIPLSAMVHRPIKLGYCVQVFEGRINLIVESVTVSSEIDSYQDNFTESVLDADKKLEELDKSYGISVDLATITTSVQTIASGRRLGAVDLLYRVIRFLAEDGEEVINLAKSVHKYVVRWMSWESRGESRLLAGKLDFLSDIIAKDGILVSETVSDILGFMSANTIIANKVSKVYRLVLDLYELDDLGNSIVKGGSITKDGKVYISAD